MSKSGGEAETKPLLVLHFVSCAALGVAWAVYCWTNYQPPRFRPGPTRRGVFESALSDGISYLAGLSGDFLLGLVVVVIFGIGTRLYLRKFQVWLDARAAGNAVAYGGADLKDQALAANANARTKR